MHTASTIGGQIYLVGGRFSSWANAAFVRRANSVERFNPVWNTWEQLAPMAAARTFHSASVIAGQLYVVGGVSEDTGVNSVECYNPEVGTWRWLRAMSRRRHLHSASVIKGQLYIAGGSSGRIPWQPEDTTDTVECYNPETGWWTSLAPMSVGRYIHTASVIREQIYVVGGKEITWPLDSAERYDPIARRWERLAPMAMPRRFHTASVLKEKLIVAGGCGSYLPTSSVEQFDPELGVWEQLPRMTMPRMLHSAAVMHEKLYILGGVKRQTMECFDPERIMLPSLVPGSWRIMPPSLVPQRCHHSASVVGH